MYLDKPTLCPASRFLVLSLRDTRPSSSGPVSCCGVAALLSHGASSGAGSLWFLPPVEVSNQAAVTRSRGGEKPALLRALGFHPVR